MKKLFFTPLLLALFFSNSTYAKIWRVNNTSGVVADFTTVQAAHDAASAGDTIHVEPTASYYGGITVSKQVVIIGNGYQLTTDTGLQANTNASTINGVTFAAGSANSSLEGITINYYTYVQDVNIAMKRNSFSYPVYLYSNNCTISGNLIYYYTLTNAASNLTGINISNNIFSYASSISFDATCTGNFTNNTLYNCTMSFYNFQVNNNILNTGTFAINNNVYFNNIGESTEFGNANGNQQNINMSTVFTYNGGTYSNDEYWTLAPGSPAINAGYGGATDCGAFGGPNPYILGGIPSVPTIYKLTVPPVGTSSINITISTKSNN
jgi:hypothetical protein